MASKTTAPNKGSSKRTNAVQVNSFFYSAADQQHQTLHASANTLQSHQINIESLREIGQQSIKSSPNIVSTNIGSTSSVPSASRAENCGRSSKAHIDVPLSESSVHMDSQSLNTQTSSSPIAKLTNRLLSFTPKQLLAFNPRLTKADAQVVFSTPVIGVRLDVFPF